jgi:hypothetical protein
VGFSINLGKAVWKQDISQAKVQLRGGLREATLKSLYIVVINYV